MDRILWIFLGRLTVAVVTLALAGAQVGAILAGEASVWPQNATGGDRSPTRMLQRLSPTDNPAAESLTEMPMAETTADRSLRLEQVAQQADRQTQHGFELAGRGAYFAARSEFLGALRLVAEGLDAEQKSDVHVRALAAGLTAMKEAEDFLPGGSRLESNLDLSGIVAAHATPALRNGTEKATALTALRLYHTFAQEQFAVAAEKEVAGSMALRALGKLHTAVAQNKGALIVAPESKAMVFYQAAMLVYPQNYMAANDLGVLLARCGHWADAQAMLEHSLALCPEPTGWQNLAVVYRQSGQTALAERAARQATLLNQRKLVQRQTSPAPANDQVQWVDRQAFAQTSINTPMNTPNMSVASRPTVAAKLQAAGTAVQTPSPPAEYGPAPTPAAAQRRSWAAPAYQR
jgi:tetratricopeptide (TPR) repeat protein